MYVHKSDCHGFTLIEAMLAISIFSLIMGGIVELILYSWRSKDIVWEQLSTQNEGRKAVQDFGNELRVAAYSSIGSYPIESAGNQQIIFYGDADKDTYRERIRYFLSGDTLRKGITIPTGTPLAYNLSLEKLSDAVHDVANATSSIFYYYDQNYTGASGTPMAAPIDVTRIRMVQVKLSLEENPRASPAPFNIESKFDVRNLKSN